MRSPARDRAVKVAGFTLTEMLIVVSLIAMISLAVFQAVSSGFRVWEYSEYYSREEDMALFLDKFSQELRNGFSYSLISFEGRADRIAFPTVVTALKDKALTGQEIDYVKQLGRVMYSFDRGSGALVRQQANYSQALNGTWGPRTVALQPLAALSFSYVMMKGDQLVKEDTADDQLPFAVEVELKYPQQSGRIMTLRKMVNIPTAMYREGFIYR